VTESYSLRAPALLDERDEYIAGRIEDTLENGETGLLLVGMAHQVVQKLSRGITVITLASAAKAIRERI
jgi:pheromone shutdown protein TraB